MDLVSLDNVETEYAWIKEVSEQMFGTTTSKYAMQHHVHQRYTNSVNKCKNIMLSMTWQNLLHSFLYV